MEKLYKDKDWLQEHYIGREESTVAMAKEARCGYETIRSWLHKYEIPVRSRSEGIFLALRNSVIITPDLLEFLRGEIIGDGCVGTPGHYSTPYSHNSKHKEYLIWLSECFNKWGIEQSGRIREYRNKQNGAIYYCYESKSYPELVPIYKRWYAERDGKMKKIVPQDLKLTPIMARQWYLGDGSLVGRERKHPGIVLSTCDFDRQSINHLIEELNRLGFKATYQPYNNSIYISVHSVQDFLS